MPIEDVHAVRIGNHRVSQDSFVAEENRILALAALRSIRKHLILLDVLAKNLAVDSGTASLAIRIGA